jgi:hypothetical protein
MFLNTASLSSVNTPFFIHPANTFSGVLAGC